MFLLNNVCINTFGFLVSEMPAFGVDCIAVVDVLRDHCVRNFKKSSASATSYFTTDPFMTETMAMSSYTNM